MASGMLRLHALELPVVRLEASSTDMMPQTFLLGLFLHFATSRLIPAVTNLVCDWDGSNLLGYSRPEGGFDRQRAEGVNGPLSGVPEVIRMKIAVRAEPSFGAAVLVFLEVRDKVVHNCGELIKQRYLKCDAFGPDCKTRATFGGIGSSNGDVYHPCRRQCLKVSERGLQLCFSVDDVESSVR